MTNSNIESNQQLYHIILIDDDQLFLDLAHIYLSRISDNLEFMLFTNPRDVIKVLRSNSKIDCVVSDYQMPGMNGIELLKQIKQMNADIPFIIFTGKSREEVAIEALNAGADYFIKKDRDAESQFTQLHHIIRAVIHHAQIEKELKKQNKRYRDLVNNMREVIYRMKVPEGEYEFVNPSIQKIFGFSVEELLQTPLHILNIVHPDSREYVKARWEEIKQGIVPDQYEYKIVLPTGETRWILQTNTGVFDENGDIKALEGICRDITVLKTIEDQLRSREKYYREFIEQAPICIFKTRLDSTLVDINTAGLELFGYKDKEQMIVDANTDKGTEIYYVKPYQRKHIRNSLQDTKWHTFMIDLRRKDNCIFKAKVHLRLNDENIVEGFILDIDSH